MRSFTPYACTLRLVVALATLSASGSASAQLVSLVDQTPAGSVDDGAINSGEYGNLSYFSAGVNSGFGDVIGSGSKIYFDSSSSGGLNIAIQSGGGALNDVIVIYIDVGYGGLHDLSTVNDNGGGSDYGRAAISGIGTTGGMSKLTFAQGFNAHYAIAIQATVANLFQINLDGTLTILKSVQLLPGSSPSDQQREMQLTVNDIGVAQGGTFKWIATLINASNGYRSNELHGSTYSGDNIGQNPFTFDNYNQFTTVSDSSTGAPDTFSPIVSYQFYDSLNDPITQPTTTSPIIAYQFFEWPGDQNLTFTNSANVSYLYNGAPVILTQPNGVMIQIGQTAILSVNANGSMPLTYQWRINGVALDNANSPTLQINSAQAANSGTYSVTVTNGYGSVVSSDAKLIVYFPPADPQPSPPSLVANPSPSATPSGTPAVTSSAQLLVFGPNGQVTPGATPDPGKPTIILTHGWLNSSADWPTKMARALIVQKFASTANIIAWDWEQAADPNGANLNSSTISIAVSLAGATFNTYGQGVALGKALMSELHPGYNLPIHFLGHSLGTLVNRVAADYVHGDLPISPGYKDPLQRYPSGNTQMTLFDEAELAQAVHGFFVDIDLLRGGSLGYEFNSFSTNVIPAHYAWADNYVSLVGFLHPEAANGMLWRELALDPPTAHGYAYNWYMETIADPSSSALGHRWSVERNTIAGSQPALDSFFTQSNSPNGSDLSLSPVSQAIQLNLENRLSFAFPTLDYYNGVSPGALLIQAALPNAVQFAGNVSASIIQSFTPPGGLPVYIGNAGSTPAFFQSPSSVSLYQANWDQRFVIGAGAASTTGQSFGYGDHPPTHLTAVKSSAANSGASYVTIPVTVPKTATAVTFQYQFQSAADGDFITMGIAGDTYLSLPATYVDDGVWNIAPLIDISSYAGQQIELTFVLNNSSGTPVGTLQIQGVQFFSPPSPTLSLITANNQVYLSWSLSALNWTLEENDDLSNPNGWTPVNLSPTDSDYYHAITLDITGENKFFFRLSK